MKLKLVAVVCSLFMSFILNAQTKEDSTTKKTTLPKPIEQSPQRRLNVTLNENTWIILINCLDRADVSHLTIRALQDSLSREFTDSTKNKIPKVK